MRDFKIITPSGRRSTAISRSSHSILRKAGFISTAAAFPLIIASPGIFLSFADLLSAPDIDRLSLLKKGPDAFGKIFRAAAQHLIAVFHRNDPFDGAGIDAHVEAFLGEPQADR